MAGAPFAATARERKACGCGARLGYHLLSACEVCEESGTRQGRGGPEGPVALFTRGVCLEIGGSAMSLMMARPPPDS